METTKTTLTSVHKKDSQEYKDFINASKSLGKLNENCIEAREIIRSIGCAINTLYTIGEAKKIKKNALADIVEQYFPEDVLNRFQRSDYRKFATGFYDYENFAQAFELKSITVPYIINKFNNHIESERIRLKIARNKKAFPNAQVDTDTGEIQTVKRQNVVIGASPMKTGIEVDAPEGKTLSTQDFLLNGNRWHNELINKYNSSQFTPDMIKDIKKMLSNSLELISKPAPELIDDFPTISKLVKVQNA